MFSAFPTKQRSLLLNDRFVFVGLRSDEQGGSPRSSMSMRDIGMYGKSIGQQVGQLIASRTIYSISMIEILHYAAQLAIFVMDYWN
jgi:hypothetical protein